MQRRIAFAALALVVSFSNSHADSVVPQSAARELLELVFSSEHSALNADERIKVASAISAACKGYRGIVPTITPDEQTWLNKEMGIESSKERMVAAADTEVFARFKSAKFLDECSFLTNGIITEQDHPIAWALLAQIFIDDDISDLLRQAAVRTVDPTDITSARLMLGHAAASTIIGRVLVPALRP